MKKNLRKEVKKAEQFFHGDSVRKKAAKYDISDDEIIDFSINVNPLGPPDSVIKSLKENIESISKYPNQTPQDLKNRLAEYAGTSPDRIIIGNGSNDLIYLITRSIVKREDKVTIVEPTFTEYRKAVMNQGGKIETIRLREQDDYRFNLKYPEYEIKKDTKLIFLCSPNNPSGGMIPLDQLKTLLRKAERSNTTVVIDEAFLEFCDNPNKYNTAELDFENLIILRSFTKFFGIPGLRFGYGIVPDNISEELAKTQVNWNVNSLAQIAAKVAIKDKRFIKETRRTIEKGKKFLKNSLENIENLRVFPSDANFFLIKITDNSLNASKILEKLLEKGIAVRPCQDFKYLSENYFRTSVRTKEDCKKLVINLREILS